MRVCFVAILIIGLYFGADAQRGGGGRGGNGGRGGGRGRGGRVGKPWKGPRKGTLYFSIL